MKKMYLICNAHIDPMWQWEWNEGMGAAISTFHVAANLCEKYDAYIFNHNEAILYEWIEEYEPQLFQKIQQLVAKGNWHIMGGWYLQPDCNMPSGESIIRQISTGLHYFEEKFHQTPTTAINFDSFGHTKGLVQIMEKSGFDSYIVCRPYGDAPEIDRFVWEGFADSKIRVLKMPVYNTPLGQSDVAIKDAMKRQANEENGVILWGVGNHGGGPSKIDLEKIAGLIADTKDVNIIHATPEQFFEATKKESWPVFSGSLQHINVGCYSSQIRIKQQHRKLENELIVTEQMLSAASMNGLMKYPQEELKRAWKDLLFSQFHDILPGSSIQPVEEAGLRLISHGLEETGRLKSKAFFKLSAGQVKAKDSEIPIMVYNVLPYAVTQTIVCEFMLPDQNRKPEFVNALVYDEDGNRVPAQVEKEYSNVPIEWRKRVVFEGKLHPASMTRFDLKLEMIPEKPQKLISVADGCYCFTTPHYTARLNKSTGLLESLVINAKEYLKKPSGKIIVIQDNEDPWGMEVQGFQDAIGTFKLADPANTAKICGIKAQELEGVHIIEDGVIRTIAECVFSYRNAQAIIRYIFPKNSAHIGVQIRMITSQKNTMYKYVLDPAIENGTLSGKTAYGLDRLRTNGLECVAQEYVIYHNRESAVSVINNGTYALSSEKGELRFTLFRTPAYCAHPIEGRETMLQDRFGERIDQGERQFEFEITFSDAATRFEAIECESKAVNQPPMAVCFFPPEYGSKPLPLCTLSNNIVQIAALKLADNGDGYVVRLYNGNIKPQETTAFFPALKLSFSAALKPFEIQSYRITDNEIKPCSIID